MIRFRTQLVFWSDFVLHLNSNFFYNDPREVTLVDLLGVSIVCEAHVISNDNFIEVGRGWNTLSVDSR